MCVYNVQCDAKWSTKGATECEICTCLMHCEECGHNVLWRKKCVHCAA